MVQALSSNYFSLHEKSRNLFQCVLRRFPLRIEGSLLFDDARWWNVQNVPSFLHEPDGWIHVKGKSCFFEKLFNQLTARPKSRALMAPPPIFFSVIGNRNGLFVDLSTAI
jgi:hypothetical protein